MCTVVIIVSVLCQLLLSCVMCTIVVIVYYVHSCCHCEFVMCTVVVVMIVLCALLL